MKNLKPFCAIVVAAGLITPSVGASVISLDAAKDNTLYNDGIGELSNGAGEFFFAGQTVGLQARRAVMSFDIASYIPAGSTINGVSLQLNMDRCGPTCFTAAILDLHRLTSDWGEGASDPFGQEGGGDQAQPGDATWLHTFYPDVDWTNPGGDFLGLVSASQAVTNLGSYIWTGTQMAADVQDWLDNPSQDFGWILFGGEGGFEGTAKRFGSKDNLTPSVRPQLLVDYTPVPEPSTIVFVGGGMVAMLRFRRR